MRERTQQPGSMLLALSVPTPLSRGQRASCYAPSLAEMLTSVGTFFEAQGLPQLAETRRKGPSFLKFYNFKTNFLSRGF